MTGGDPRLWWLAGEDAADLARQLDRPGAGPGDPPRVERGPARLGIADPDDRKLRLARRLLAEGGAWRGRSDIWYSSAGLARAGGRVAFLFPGVEPTFGIHGMDLPGLAARFGLVAPLLEDDTIAHRSASIYRVGIFLDQVMHHLGIAPDLIAGHSIGEWSGSVAAGIIPAAHAAGLLDVIDPSTVEFPDLDFAAFAAGVDAVAAVVDRLDDVVVSHDNSPGQSIVCGTPAMVDEAVARLRERNVLGYKLGFQSGFHTPAMTESLPTFRAHLDAMEIGPGHIPMWSATSVAPYPRTRAEIIDLHLRHLEEPVRFRPLVERLYHDAGVRVFVQVGVGSLPGFVADTLGDLDHASVAVLTPRRSALAQVSRVLTALWVEGLDVDPGMLRDAGAPGPGSAAAPTGNGAPTRNGAPQPDPSPATRPDLDRLRAPVGVASGRPSATTTATPVTPSNPPTAPFRAEVSATLTAAADMLTAASRASQDVLDALALRLSSATVPAARTMPAPSASTVRTIAPPRSLAPTGGAGSAPADVVPAGVADQASPPPAAPPSIPAWTSASALDWPTETTTIRRLLSLETMPETIDHTLYEAPAGWPDVSDRFPIVAMTTQLQLLEDIATSYSAGRDVVELFAVRNYRWLDISDPIDLEITVTPKGDDVLGIALGAYCRANVRVGRFPPAPRYDDPPLVRPRPTAHTAQEMFDLRLMFHGPRFQGIRDLGPVGDDGMLGTFDNLATPGSLLDNLGKLIAYWAIDYDGVGEAALPSGVGRVELFGPKPAPGVEVRCDIRVIEQQRDLIRADGVLVLPDGSILARVHGWTSILFHLDELMEPLHHAPGRVDVAEAQPGGWYVVRERWPTGPARDLTARRYLARDDRARYERMNLLEQRRWLLDVIAAKDAVRHWLRDTFGILCFPVEVGLVPDGDRRFRVTCGRLPEGHDPRVTLSSFNWVAVAVVGDGEFRDIEAVPVGDDGDAASAAHRAADAVAARNPGAEVRRVEERENDVPSRLEVPDPPPFAVAWI